MAKKDSLQAASEKLQKRINIREMLDASIAKLNAAEVSSKNERAA